MNSTKKPQVKSGVILRCEPCDKGFRSKKDLLGHLASKRHRERIAKIDRKNEKLRDYAVSPVVEEEVQVLSDGGCQALEPDLPQDNPSSATDDIQEQASVEMDVGTLLENGYSFELGGDKDMLDNWLVDVLSNDDAPLPDLELSDCFVPPPVRWASMYPNAGGGDYGYKAAFNNADPLFVLSDPESVNEKYLHQLFPTAVKITTDDMPEDFTGLCGGQQLDVVTCLAPCAGLSSLNNSTGLNQACSSNPKNKIMTHSAEFILKRLRPRCMVGENAPELFWRKGEGVVQQLKKIGEENGYSLTLYQTCTSRHGLPQKRARTFYIFWLDCVAKALAWIDLARLPLADFLGNLPDNSSLRDTFLAKGKPSDFPPYKFLLEQVGNGSHGSLCSNNAAGYGIYTWLRKKGLLKDAEVYCGKVNATKEENYIRRIREKLENGTDKTGFWDDSPHVPETVVPAITNRKVRQLTHPTEDRYLSLREILSLMGLPQTFEVPTMDYQAFCQGVPVDTAKSIGQELMKYLDGRLPDVPSTFLKQSNVTRMCTTEQTSQVKRRQQTKKPNRSSRLGTYGSLQDCVGTFQANMGCVIAEITVVRVCRDESRSVSKCPLDPSNFNGQVIQDPSTLYTLIVTCHDDSTVELIAVISWQEMSQTEVIQEMAETDDFCRKLEANLKTCPRGMSRCSCLTGGASFTMGCSISQYTGNRCKFKRTKTVTLEKLLCAKPKNNKEDLQLIENNLKIVAQSAEAFVRSALPEVANRMLPTTGCSFPLENSIWSGATVVSDYSCHQHFDVKNMTGGVTAVVTLLRKEMGESTQMHVLHSYKGEQVIIHAATWAIYFTSCKHS